MLTKLGLTLVGEICTAVLAWQNVITHVGVARREITITQKNIYNGRYLNIWNLKLWEYLTTINELLKPFWYLLHWLMKLRSQYLHLNMVTSLILKTPNRRWLYIDPTYPRQIDRKSKLTNGPLLSQLHECHIGTFISNRPWSLCRH